MATKITSITKTYTLIKGDMVHDGYFITSNNYPLKYISKWAWETVIKSPRYRVNLDGILSRMQNAQ